MKIKRFTAPNMREAMRLVREEQGPEAMILSSRRTDEGVEVVAATDYDVALLQQQPRAAATSPPATAPVVETAPPVPPAVTPVAPFSAAAADVAEQSEPSPRMTRILREPVLTVRARPLVSTPASATASAPTSAHSSVTPPDDRMDEIRREMRSLRSVLETRLADSENPRTAAAQALRALLNMNLSPALAHSLVAENPPAEGSTRMPLGPLALRIPVLSGGALEQGVFALVGPTGVGKTTTVAKLAAHYTRLHGTREVALISTDNYRIGAQEQLHTYARLLGVPVLTAGSADEIRQALTRLSDRRVVLMDTAGLAPRDERLTAQLHSLGAATAVQRLLVLPAGGQLTDLEDCIRQFSATPLAGCILTKLDEATRIGAALSAVVRHRLPLAYVSDGQRVPEDLHPPQPFHLVVRAQQLARQIPSSADTPLSESLTSTATGAAHVA